MQLKNVEQQRMPSHNWFQFRRRKNQHPKVQICCGPHLPYTILIMMNLWGVRQWEFQNLQFPPSHLLTLIEPCILIVEPTFGLKFPGAKLATCLAGSWVHSVNSTRLGRSPKVNQNHFFPRFCCGAKRFGWWENLKELLGHPCWKCLLHLSRQECL